MKIVFFTGPSGGDYFAVEKAVNLGLLNAKVVHMFSSTPNSRALKKYFSQSSIGSALNFSTSKRMNAFEKCQLELEKIDFDLIILAGFPYLLPPIFVDQYKNKIINSHHSLLPAHPGLFHKENLVASDDKFLGATIHLVNRGVDTGPKLFQAAFPNSGMPKFENILQIYRFVQDVMMVQCVRDFGNREDKNQRVTLVNQIMFNPGIEIDILEAYPLG